MLLEHQPPFNIERALRYKAWFFQPQGLSAAQLHGWKKPQRCFHKHFTAPMLGPLPKISLDLHIMEFQCLKMHIILSFCMSSLSHAVHARKIHGKIDVLPPRGQVWSRPSDREIDSKQSSKLCYLLHFYNRRVLAVKTGSGVNHWALYLQ